MKRTLAALLVLAVALPSPALWAEETAGLEVGERVRFVQTGKGGGKLEGTLVARNLEALTLKVDGQSEQISVPLESVQGLEVQRGRKGNLGKGMGIGFLAGAGLGVIAGQAWNGTPDVVVADSGKPGMTLHRGGPLAPRSSSTSDDDYTGALMALGGVVGAVLGAVVGLAIRTDRWEELGPDALRVAVGPTRGGGVAAQVSFGF